MGSRLFVGNLSYSCSEADLRALFEARWSVLDVRIVTDRETGRSRGFAFVELDGDPSAAQAIDALDGHELGGRKLAVREAHERTAKPPRRRAEPRSEPAVEAVVRRGSLGVVARRRPNESDSRCWQAPPEPPGIAGWGAPDEDRRAKEKPEPDEPEC